MDGVEARIGTHQAEHLAVVVADGAHVELLGPAGLGVHHRHVVQEGAAELVQLGLRRAFAQKDQLEDGLDFQLLVIIGIEGFQTVVTELAAHGSKEVVTLLEGLQEVGVGVDFHTGGGTQLLQIGFVGLGVLDGHGLVRPPGGDDLCAEGMLGNHLVPAQVVGRVVGGAHGLHVELADEGLAAEFGRSQLGVALVKDFTGGGGAQQFVNAEHARQLQVRPVVQGVPHGVGNGLGPLLEGLPGAVLAAGEIVLGNAVAAHRTPFIMVAVVAVHQPQLGDVTELDVFRYLLRHQVAVVVDDGHTLGMLVVQLPGGLRLEHEIFVYKGHSILF